MKKNLWSYAFAILATICSLLITIIILTKSNEYLMGRYSFVKNLAIILGIFQFGYGQGVFLYLSKNKKEWLSKENYKKIKIDILKIISISSVLLLIVSLSSNWDYMIIVSCVYSIFSTTLNSIIIINQGLRKYLYMNILVLLQQFILLVVLIFAQDINIVFICSVDILIKIILIVAARTSIKTIVIDEEQESLPNVRDLCKDGMWYYLGAWLMYLFFGIDEVIYKSNYSILGIASLATYATTSTIMLMAMIRNLILTYMNKENRHYFLFIYSYIAVVMYLFFTMFFSIYSFLDIQILNKEIMIFIINVTVIPLIIYDTIYYSLFILKKNPLKYFVIIFMLVIMEIILIIIFGKTLSYSIQSYMCSVIVSITIATIVLAKFAEDFQKKHISEIIIFEIIYIVSLVYPVTMIILLVAVIMKTKKVLVLKRRLNGI